MPRKKVEKPDPEVRYAEVTASPELMLFAWLAANIANRSSVEISRSLGCTAGHVSRLLQDKMSELQLATTMPLAIGVAELKRRIAAGIAAA